jgi:hypothetical protein
MVLTANSATRLDAWRHDSQKADVPSSWRVPVGKVTSKSGSVLWQLGPVPPGVYEADLMVGGSKACTFRIAVVSSKLELRDSKRQSGAGFLLAEESEPAGYGLYSYVLLASRPEAQNRARYQSVIQFVLKFETVGALAKYIPQQEINNTLIPLRTRLPQYLALKLAGGEDADYASVSDWVFENYDYARARSILRNVSGETFFGPYILSVSSPSHLDALDREKHLLQDFSTVREDLIVHWIRHFQYQAQQVRFWDTNNLRSFQLQLRTGISHVAEAIKPVRLAGKELADLQKTLVQFR